MADPKEAKTGRMLWKKLNPLDSKKKRKSRNNNNIEKDDTNKETEKEKETKFVVTDDYSRGSSGKGLREKFSTPSKVLGRLSDLNNFIQSDLWKIQKLKRKIGATKAEAERLLQIAKERDYTAILDRAQEEEWSNLKGVCRKFLQKEEDQKGQNEKQGRKKKRKKEKSQKGTGRKESNEDSSQD